MSVNFSIVEVFLARSKKCGLDFSAFNISKIFKSLSLSLSSISQMFPSSLSNSLIFAEFSSKFLLRVSTYSFS